MLDLLNTLNDPVNQIGGSMPVELGLAGFSVLKDTDILITLRYFFPDTRDDEILLISPPIHWMCSDFGGQIPIDTLDSGCLILYI